MATATKNVVEVPHPGRCPVSPVLPREERDAIRARNDRVGNLDGRHDRLWIEAAEASLDDVPALLDALDAAEEENERLRAVTAAQPYETERELAVAYDEATAMRVTAEHQRDAARAEVAVLRGRIEGLHRPDKHGPGRCDEPDCITSCRECGDDWPCATIRALAADEREEDFDDWPHHHPDPDRDAL